MAESGYHGAQVARIAREAGVADGTVYLYFKNKEDLLLSILRETIGQIVTLSRLLEGGQAEARTALQGLIESHFSTLGRDPALAMVLQVHLRQPDPELRERIGEIMRPYRDVLRKILSLGQSQGTIRRDIDAKVARRMIFGTIDETVNAWIFTGGNYDLRSLAAPVFEILMGGIGEPPRA